MTGNEYKKLSDFDASLVVGQEVFFRFTNNHRFRRVKVQITKINAKSIRGACLEPYVTDLGTYPKGHEFKVPRITDMQSWTANNSVEHPDLTAHLASAEHRRNTCMQPDDPVVDDEPLISKEQAQRAMTAINGTNY